MKEGKNQGRLRSGFGNVTGLLWTGALSIMLIGGCARFNEYVAPPTIVDASKHSKSGQPTYQPVSNDQAHAESQPERVKPYSEAAPTPPQNLYAPQAQGQGQPVSNAAYQPPSPYAPQNTAQPAVNTSPPHLPGAGLQQTAQPSAYNPATTYPPAQTVSNYGQNQQVRVTENYAQAPQANPQQAYPAANPLRPATGQPVVSNVTATAVDASTRTNPFANNQTNNPTQTPVQRGDANQQLPAASAPGLRPVQSGTTNGSLPPLYAEKPNTARQPGPALTPVISPALNQQPVLANQMPPTGGLQPAVAERDISAGRIDPVHVTMKQLENALQQQPSDQQTQLALRFLYLAYGMEDKALGLIPSLPSTQQTDVIALTRTISLLTQAEKSGNQNNSFYANQALEAMQQWTAKLAARADFKISRLVICGANSVKGFGQYQAVPQSKLQAGQPLQTQIYCELSNFKSLQQDDGRFRSNVAVEIALYDVANNYNVIVKRPRTEIPDMSLNKRRDFFFYGPLQIPTLPPGEYELMVKVEDLIGNKAAVPARYKFTVQGTSRSY
jgi:hypothetical protein